MKCQDCPFYGIKAGEREPHCLVNTHLTDDHDLPCIELEQGEQEEG